MAKLSKAEKERREYMNQMAQRLVKEMLVALNDKTLEEMRQEQLFQDGQTYRNQGAIKLAQLLKDAPDHLMRGMIEEIARIPDMPGGFKEYRLNGERIYPLPL